MCRGLLAAGCALAAGLSGIAHAASLGSESSIGLVADYNSNPLLISPARSTESAAFVANLPVSYNGERQTWDLAPRLRFATTHGPSALLTDYQYLDADWSYTGERNVLGASGGWHHDSTLLNQYEQGVIQGHTVYRQEDSAALSWLRHWSVRDDVRIAGTWDRQQYDAAAQGALTSYGYAQGSLSWVHSAGERWQLTGTAGAGAYQLLGRTYRSQQWFGQVAAKRALSERWSLTAQGGYSYLRDHQTLSGCSVYPLLCYEYLITYGQLPDFQVRQHSSHGAPNGALILEHTYERAWWDLSISRAIEPSGLGVLVTQDDAAVSGTFDLSERWTLAGTVHASRILDSLGRLPLGNRRYYDADLSAGWQWTEHWTLQLQGTYTVDQYGNGHRPNAGVSLSLSRQFGRLRLGR